MSEVQKPAVVPESSTFKKYIYPIDPTGTDAPALLLRAVGRGSKVLEMGCASGVQSKAMRDQGCEVTGIEIDPEAAEQARAYCKRVIVGNLEILDFDTTLGDERFDVITIADVLEHLRQPERILRSSVRFLKPGGRIIASIPNVVYAGLILEMTKGRFDYRPYGLLDDTHIRFFTLKSIVSTFEGCGLTITQLDRVVRPLEQSEFAVNRPLIPSEVALLNFIRENNPEHETYQFVVCAQPASTAVAGKKELELREELKDMQFRDAAHVKRISKLESDIAWMRKHPMRTLVATLWGAIGLGSARRR